MRLTEAPEQHPSSTLPEGEMHRLRERSKEQSEEKEIQGEARTGTGREARAMPGRAGSRAENSSAEKNQEKAGA